MAEFNKIVGKFFLITLVIVSLFSVIVLVQNDNNVTNKISNDPTFNNSFGNLLDVVDNSTEASQEKYDVFTSEEPKEGFGSIVLFGIVSVGRSFSNIIFGTLSAVIELPLTVLGIPASTINLIIAWLIIAVIVSVWLLYKLGG